MTRVDKRPGCDTGMALGIFLLNLLFFPILTTTLAFLFGAGVSVPAIIIALAAAVAFSYCLSGRNLRQTAGVCLTGLALAAACILLCCLCLDWSHDGNAYHKAVVGLLRDGWNPLKESFYSFAAGYDFLKEESATWFDAYPKAAETWGACIYLLTGNIEAGKAFNLISGFALFFLCQAFLGEGTNLKPWQRALCAGALVLNPVSVSQCLTFYVDSFLWMLLLLFLAALLYLTLREKGRYEKLSCYLLFVSIAVGLNVKFSGLIFFGIPGIAFFLYWSISALCRQARPQAKKLIARRFVLLAAAVLCGLLLLGCDSYVTNTIRYHNPLYTMIGEGSTELILSQLPPAFAELSNAERFVASLFSRYSNSMSLTSIQWKIPFTVHREELTAYVDTRISGWGIFFSGILILSIAVLAAAALKHRREWKKELEAGGLLLASALIGIFAVPGLFWARYFVGLSYVPAAAMAVLFARANRRNTGKKRRYLPAMLLTGLLCLNLAMPAARDGYELLNSFRMRAELQQFSALCSEKTVTLGYSPFYGHFFDLRDRGITAWQTGDVPAENCDGSIFGKTCLYYTAE